MGQSPSQQQIEKLKSQRLDSSQLSAYLSKLNTAEDI